MSKYEKLLSPVKVGNLVLKNRIFSAPASLNYIGQDGSLPPEAIAFYEKTAMGGCALVTYGEVCVHPETGKSHDRQLCVNDPQRLVDLAKLARAVHRHGARVSAELSHGGKYGGLVSMAGTMDKHNKAYGASHEMTPEGEVFEMPKELLLEVIDSFGRGAAALQRAGFDMCMIHAGHGWLFGQFLSERTNHRTDEFGGSFENRAKPLLMALDSIRKYTGKNFPIEVRISGDEYIEGGITLQDSERLVKMIEDKCDMINVSAGIHEGPHLFIRTHPTSYLPKGPNVFLAEAIKKDVNPKIPISTVGGIGDPDLAEEILETGKADIIEMRRPLLADPFLPKKLMEGREDEIRRCLRCNNCFNESLKTNTISCAINPEAGSEYDAWVLRAQPVGEKKKVVIVGGGPGGMQAAITAAERGHDVVIYEKADQLGGTLNYFQYIDFKYDMYVFARTLERNVRKLSNITVHTGVEVTKEMIRQEKPDEIIVAAGAHPVTPRIPGIDGKNVKLAKEIFGKLDNFDDSYVVIGGGLVGCETAAYLARSGKKVAIVEMRDKMAADSSVFEQAAVVGDMEKNGVDMYVSTAAKEITADGLVVTLKNGEEKLIKAATIVSAVGYAPNVDTYLDLALEAPVVNTIGDCRRHGLVKDAVNDGYFLALGI